MKRTTLGSHKKKLTKIGQPYISLTEKGRLSGASRSEQMFEDTVVPPNSRLIGSK